MTQWAEVRHLHLVERVPKKEIARRLKLDVKTVRRAISRSTTPVRVSPPRPGTLDPWRERIRQWLGEEPRLTAKRIRRLLLPMAGPLPARTVRRYVAVLRAAGTRKEAFVHRSVLPGTTMEVDFGESWVDLAGVPCKVKYLVATLPFSNAYFAKAYPVERLESLLDGIESAFRYFGGLVDRLVLDNTSLAVKDVLAGRDRVQTEAFDAFRGGVSVPGGVLRAGQGLGEGFCGGRCEIRPEPGVPAAAGSRELDGPQRGDHRQALARLGPGRARRGASSRTCRRERGGRSDRRGIAEDPDDPGASAGVAVRGRSRGA